MGVDACGFVCRFLVTLLLWWVCLVVVLFVCLFAGVLVCALWLACENVDLWC